MNIARIEGYAYGDRSGATWSEHIYLTENGYISIKDVVDNIDVYIAELDGKHSEVKADIYVDIIKDNELGNYRWRNQTSKNMLFDSISYRVEKLELDFDVEEDREKVRELLAKIDPIVDCEIQIKSSQFEDLKSIVRKNFDGWISLK